ncbi:unknown [Prevotella sp. CAG:386]|nr:unknown [Prevotella sp. CAG:386]
MLGIISLNLYGTNGTLGCVDIGAVVHMRAVPCLELLQHLCKFSQALVGKTLTKHRVLRHRREMVALEHGLNIKSRSATKDGQPSPSKNILIGIIEVLLILKEVVLGSWLADIYEMIGNLLVPYCIVGQILARSYIHSAIHLSAVGTDNLGFHPVHTRRKGSSQGSSKTGLSACRRTQYRYHRLFHGGKDTKISDIAKQRKRKKEV